MPYPALFSDMELRDRLNEGLKTAEIAREFNCSERAVQKRMRKLKGKVANEVALHQTGKMVRQGLDAAEQLQKINDNANQLLDLLVGAVERWQKGGAGEPGGTPEAAGGAAMPAADLGPGQMKGIEDLGPLLGDRGSVLEAVVKIQGEIRQQLKLAFDIRKDLFEIEEIQRVLNIILEAIGRAAPGVREQIIAELKGSGVLSAAMGWY